MGKRARQVLDMSKFYSLLEKEGYFRARLETINKSVVVVRYT